MRPVSTQFPTSQAFGEGATQGVVANSNPNSGMGYYVWLYGNYQPFGHAGMDIACPIGTPIYAPADGTVLYAGWTEDLPGSGPIRKWLMYYNFGGILTVTQHNGWISAIAHQSDNNAVRAGMQVKEGQLIGKSGNTKTRTTTVAAHAHIEALVFMDYRTDVSKGIVYGRVNPEPFFGSAAIGPQGTIKQEDELSAAEVQEIKEYVHALLIGGYNSAGEARPGIADVISKIDGRTDRYLDAPVSAVPEKTWAQTVTRGGKQISVKQELADSKSLAEKAAGTLAAQVAIAQGSGLTADQITAAVKAALSDATVTVEFDGGK